MLDSTSNDDLPSAVRSHRKLSASGAFGMIARFLKSELRKQDPAALQHGRWEDLFRISETLVGHGGEATVLRNLRLSAPVLSTSQSMAVSPDGTREQEESTYNTPTKGATVKVEASAGSDGVDKASTKEEKKRKKSAKADKKEKKRKRQSVEDEHE